MRKDTIVEEVRKHRTDNAAKFDFDIRAIAKDARSREKKSGHRIATPPKRERQKI